MTRTMFLASSALVFGTVAAHAATLIKVDGEGSSLASPTYTAEFKKSQPAAGFSFTEYTTSSGRGFTALLLNIGSGNPGNPNTGSGVPANLAVDWGASDSFLTSSNVSAYNAQTGAAGAPSGQTDLQAFGPIIQVAMLGTSITVPVNNYKGTTNLAKANNPETVAKAKFTDADLCAAFSGKATTWQQLSAGASLGNTGPFNIAVRSDKSGTSFLFSQHLAAVCNSTNSNFTSADLASFPRQDLYADATIAALPNLLLASGSSGIQGLFVTSTGAANNKELIGYLSPDYTAIAKASGVANASKVYVAAVNGVVPTVANVQTALLASNNTNIVNANPEGGVGPTNATEAQNPVLYVPGFPAPNAGYPIVGYTNWDLVTCYKSGKGGAISSFITKQYAGSASVYYSTITNNGFTNVTDPTLVSAVNNYILTNNGSANVNIGNATACAGTVGR